MKTSKFAFEINWPLVLQKTLLKRCQLRHFIGWKDEKERILVSFTISHQCNSVSTTMSALKALNAVHIRDSVYFSDFKKSFFLCILYVFSVWKCLEPLHSPKVLCFIYFRSCYRTQFSPILIQYPQHYIGEKALWKILQM